MSSTTADADRFEIALPVGPGHARLRGALQPDTMHGGALAVPKRKTAPRPADGAIGPGLVGATAAGSVALACVIGLAGCTIDVQNPKPAQEVARLARPPGSAYAGWRVFQDKCAACHGTDATGTERGPDLLPRVRAMGARRFFSVVLARYDAIYPGTPPGSDAASREAAVEEIVQGRGPLLAMPQWRGEPRVEVHMNDLHAYLAARAEGTLGPGRPTP